MYEPSGNVNFCDNKKLIFVIIIIKGGAKQGSSGSKKKYPGSIFFVSPAGLD